MVLTLRALGPPEADLDGAEVPPELTWRKHFGLLVYLARSPGATRRRDHLVGLLWPDKAEAKARHSLNEACRAIRRALGAGALVTRADQVSLDIRRVAADWLAAERALDAGDAPALLGLWRGDFLEGFGIPDATPFEDWLAAERAEWGRRLRDALTLAAAQASAAGRHADALRLAERVLRADPLAEGALRVAMVADALASAAPAALARFDRYVEHLRADTGAAPAADLEALAGRIRAGLRPAEPGPPAEPLSPLVGREAALAAIAPWLPAAGGRCALVLVTGTPGGGKTRLLREATERVRLAGARVVRLTCVAADADAPGGVLAALLARGLADAAGLAGTNPDALAALAALAPAVARRFPAVVPRAAPNAGALGRATGEALLATAREGPVALALDDVHLADEATLEALPALVHAAEEAPVRLLLAARLDETVPAALMALRARLGHDVPGVEIPLAPLDDGDVAALAGWFLPGYGHVERDRLVRRLRAEAGGVPLFIVEILRGLKALGGRTLPWPEPGVTTGAPLPFPIPGAALAALTLRVRALPPEVQAALRAAAVAGPRPDPALLAQLLDEPVAVAETRLDALARAGWLREEDGVYIFQAEIVRVFIEQELLSSPKRRQLHRRAAEALGAGGPSLALAEHWYAAGAWATAADVARGVLQAAQAAGAFRRAERARRLLTRAAERANRSAS